MPFVSVVKLIRENRSVDGSVIMTMEEYVISDITIERGADTDNMRVFAEYCELIKRGVQSSASKIQDST